MTFFIADIASYQGSISLADLRGAGFTGINVKISHGLGQKSVHERVATYVRDARAAGMQLSCFHWLTGDASGVAQADYAYRRMAELGLNVPGVVAVVDVEGTASTAGGEPTGTVYRDFLGRMRALLGRPVVTYTGDWYAESRSWLRAGADSPWLHSAPTDGYVPTYPGDNSLMWDAGYAGWEALSIMQYRVAKVSGIQVSQSAIRSADVWSMMAGGNVASWILVPCLVALRNEFNEVAPKRDKGADGSIGDTSHAASSSDHNPDETGNTPYEDADDINEVHAIDTDSTGPWPDGKGGEAGGWFDRKVRAIAAREKVEYESPNILGRLQNIIWRGQIISRSWGWSEWRPYTGASQHFDHAHFSARYVTETERDTRSWGVAVIEGENVEQADIDKIVAGVKNALNPEIDKVPGEVMASLLTSPAGIADDDGKWRFDSYVYWTFQRANAVLAAVNALAARDDVDEAALAAALAPAIAATIAPMIIDSIESSGAAGITPEQIESATANALRAVFADAASPDSSPA